MTLAVEHVSDWNVKDRYSLSLIDLRGHLPLKTPPDLALILAVDLHFGLHDAQFFGFPRIWIHLNHVKLHKGS